MIINTKLTITDLVEQKPMAIFLVLEACAVPLVSEFICHSLNVNKALRSIYNIIPCDFESLHETG